MTTATLWFLVILTTAGGATTVGPMASKTHCLRAAEQVATLNGVAPRAFCLSWKAELQVPGEGS